MDTGPSLRLCLVRNALRSRRCCLHGDAPISFQLSMGHNMLMDVPPGKAASPAPQSIAAQHDRSNRALHAASRAPALQHGLAGLRPVQTTPPMPQGPPQPCRLHMLLPCTPCHCSSGEQPGCRSTQRQQAWPQQTRYRCVCKLADSRCGARPIPTHHPESMRQRNSAQALEGSALRSGRLSDAHSIGAWHSRGLSWAMPLEPRAVQEAQQALSDMSCPASKILLAGPGLRCHVSLGHGEPQPWMLSLLTCPSQM